MHLQLATLTINNSRRITEVGALVALIGALVLAGAALRPFRAAGLFVGGLVLAIGLALLLVAIHFGVNPYRR